MTYSINDQNQAIDYIKYHVSLPYVLGLHDEKSYYMQRKALKTMRPELWHIFNDSTIKKLVDLFSDEYYKTFGDVETYY